MTIKELRTITGLTQTEFGNLMGGIPMRSIQNWELGHRIPSPYIVNLIEFKVTCIYKNGEGKSTDENNNKKSREGSTD